MLHYQDDTDGYWANLTQLPTLYSAEEACEGLHLEESRLIELAKAGYAPCVRIEDKILFQKHVVKLWLKDKFCVYQGGRAFPKLNLIRAAPPIGGFEARPPNLQQIDGLQQIPFPLLGNVSGIYFLCLSDIIVYVGQSMSVLQRVCIHIKENTKLFDSIYYLPVPQSALLEVERNFIRTLKPKYNERIKKD